MYIAKDLAWHATQFFDYGNEQRVHMPQAKLILPNLFHRNNSRRQAIYPTEFAKESVKNMPLRKRHMKSKLAMSMGCQKPQFIVGLLH